MKSRRMLYFIILFLAATVHAAPGDVDPGFNPQISSFGFGPFIYAVKVQSNGKSIIGGQFDTFNGTSRNLVARVNTDGSLDTTFTSPFTATSGSGNNLIQGIAQDLVIQPDGKILVGGVLTFASGVKYLVRLNADGSLDTAFNANIGGDNIYKIVLQPDGKIIIGSNGLQTVDGTPVNYLARLNQNGSLDAPLGATGELPGFVYSIALQTDGKIVVGGGNYLVRLNGNGTNDSGFTPLLGNSADYNPLFYAVAVQPDGKILAGGRNRNLVTNSSQGILVRLNANGSQDTSFVAPTIQFTATVFTILVQPSGKILFGGSFIRVNNTTRGCIARLDSNGSLDAFHPNPFGASDTIFSIAVQTDGKVLIAGQFEWVGDFNNVSRTGFARLFDSAQPPASVTKLKVTGGNVLVGSPGQGIILKSPGGAACTLLSINNAGEMVLTTISCP